MPAITLTELEDAQLDATAYGVVVNGAADVNGTGLVATRTGGPKKTLAKLEAEYQAIIDAQEVQEQTATAAAETAVSAAQGLSPFVPTGLASSLLKILDARGYGLDPTKFYHVRRFWYHDVGTRHIITITESDDASGTGATDVCEFANNDYTRSGPQWVTATPVGGSGISFDVLVRYTGTWGWYSGTYADAGLSPRAEQDRDLNKALIAEVADERIAADKLIADGWAPTVTEPKLLNLIKDFRVNNGVPGREYALRLFWDRSGPGSTRRFSIQLLDNILGENVAYVALNPSETTGDEVPKSVTATGASAGSPLNNSSLAKFTGTSVTVWFNQGVIDFDDGYNGTTDTYAEAGINPDKVLSRDQCRLMLLNMNPVREELITVGATGYDFTQAQDAFASLLRDPDVPRSGYPYSNFCSASNQIRIKIMDKGHTEEWIENIVDQGGGIMVAQGMLMMMGMILELSEDCVLHTTGSNEAQGPLFERNFGGLVIGPASARCEQRGQGYIDHKDAGNNLSRPALVGPADQFFQIVRMWDGPTRWAHDGHDSWMTGCGISDDEFDIERSIYIREAGSATTKAMYGGHNSPDSIRRGRIFFNDCVFNDADSPTTAIGLITLEGESPDCKHEIHAATSRLDAIAASAAYVYMGAIPNGATVEVGGVPL